MELINLSPELLLFLFIISIIAGLIDTLAGGGGLITIPALIMSGVPPLAALGTNKLQGCMGTATATFMMLKNRRVNWSTMKTPMIYAFIGAAIGTIIVQFLNTEVLSFVIPIVLLSIGIYFLVSPMANEGQSKPRLTARTYQHLIIPPIGCYDGMFGPGTGSFFALSAVSLRGRNLLTATAMAKPLNFSTNIASLIIFLIAGQIVWAAGLVMMLGQIIGAWLGSNFLFKVNPKYLRGLVVIMCFGMLIKYVDSMGWTVTG